MAKILLACALLLLTGCLQPLEAPGPQWEPDDYSSGTPSLSFTYRVSNISPGAVRFRNYSSGMLRFDWYFGFYDENGLEVTIPTPAPTIRYPKNGRYNVRLRGLGNDSSYYWLSEWLEISNMPN